MPNSTRNQYVREHLTILLRNEAYAFGIFRKSLFSAYNRAGQIYESGAGTDGIKTILRSLPEELYYNLVAVYKKAIPEYGRFILSGIKTDKKIETLEFKDSTTKPDSFFVDLSVEWILQEGLKRSRLIDQTVVDDINNIIEGGIRNGLSIPDISKSIRNSASDLSRFRSNTIAITEVHNASMFASVESAKATGLNLVKEWASTEDSRVRPTHQAADGQQRDMNEKFSVGGALMDRPGDPMGPPQETINCRCTLLYKEKDYNFN